MFDVFKGKPRETRLRWSGQVDGGLVITLKNAQRTNCHACRKVEVFKCTKKEHESYWSERGGCRREVGMEMVMIISR